MPRKLGKYRSIILLFLFPLVTLLLSSDLRALIVDSRPWWRAPKTKPWFHTGTHLFYHIKHSTLLNFFWPTHLLCWHKHFTELTSANLLNPSTIPPSPFADVIYVWSLRYSSRLRIKISGWTFIFSKAWKILGNSNGLLFSWYALALGSFWRGTIF